MLAEQRDDTALAPDIDESDVWEELRVMIDDRLVDSKFEKTEHQFLPEGELDDAFRTFVAQSQHWDDPGRVIFWLLNKNPESATDEEVFLVNYILDKEKPAIKLLVILCYAKHGKIYDAMTLFMHQQVWDSILPIDWSSEQIKNEYHNHPFVLLEKGARRIWTKAAVRDFHLHQKIFSAPVLSTIAAERPASYGYRVLPFTSRAEKFSRGAYGVVYKYEVHAKHFHDPDFRSTPPYVVAIKALKKRDRVSEQWNNEIRALLKMNSLSQQHIVQFLTAFRRGMKDDLEHLVVFEWADGGNLGDLWAAIPQPELTAQRVQWVVKQLHGLANALSAAHYLKEDDGVYRGASYRHGDIKPENILWFRGDGTTFGTLKICDWGEAKNHNVVTQLRHATTTQFGTRRYEPPETVNSQSSLSEAAQDARSRLYDIWSMGCVTLEFIIWLVYGFEELRKFNQCSIGDHNKSDFFYEFDRNGESVIHGAVRNLLWHMTNDPFCRPGQSAIGDILDVIEKGLLVVKLPQVAIAQPPDFPAAYTNGLAVMDNALPQSNTVQQTSAKEVLTDRYAGNGTSSKSGGLGLPSSEVFGSDHVSRGTPRTSPPARMLPTNVFAPEVKVSPADEPATQLVESESQQYGKSRSTATKIAEQFGYIDSDDHAEDYWLASKLPRPAPQSYEGRNSQTYLQINKNRPSSKSAIVQQQQVPTLDPLTLQDPRLKDYAHPVMNLDSWTYQVDNDFAAPLCPEHPPTSHPVDTQQPSCDICEKFKGKIENITFDTTIPMERLRTVADNRRCGLCRLLWKACVRESVTNHPSVKFERQNSVLKITGKETPVIILFQNNVKGRVDHNDLQIGIVDLPAAGDDGHLRCIKAWLAECDNEHSCKPNFERVRMPTRLIDVGGNDKHVVRLQVDHGQTTDAWIALSYRWDSQPHFQTTQGNIVSHTQGMLVSELPVVFQDAIKMTRVLGLRYLWIDSICIIQGPHGDFQRESKRMEDVYSGAYCVLAASCGKSHRLFEPRVKRDYVALRSKTDPASVLYVSEMLDNFKDHVLGAPLSKRGWVMQEHALARRTIFFTEYQTYWECGHGVRCESMTKMKNEAAALLGDPEFPKIMDPAGQGERIVRFQELYQQYSRLALSSDYDRPAAIVGLERRLLRAMNVKGGFGIFDDRNNPGLLRRSLLWHGGSNSLQVISFPKEREKVPSWSWMSVLGPIDYFRIKFSGFEWQEIHSPWLRADEGTTGNEIVAKACSFDGDPFVANDSNIKLDCSSQLDLTSSLAVIVGIEKGLRPPKDKRHYVLIVRPLSSVSAETSLTCTRIGAGYMPGRLLRQDLRPCIIT